MRRFDEVNYNGCRFLASAVIKYAILENDLYFLENGLSFYVALMCGGKDDYELRKKIVQEIQKRKFGLKIVKGSKYEEVTMAVKKNNGYCPCKVEKTDENKCICREFMNSDKVGECHCGRYKKVEV